jgi:hypothetical protein
MLPLVFLFWAQEEPSLRHQDASILYLYCGHECMNGLSPLSPQGKRRMESKITCEIAMS